LCAGFVGPRGFVLVLSTVRAMEHGFSPFGRANYENAFPAVLTIHHVIDRARIFHSHGARDGAMRVGITAPDQARKTIEEQPQTASLRRLLGLISGLTLLRTVSPRFLYCALTLMARPMVCESNRSSAEAPCGSMRTRRVCPAVSRASAEMDRPPVMTRITP